MYIYTPEYRESSTIDLKINDSLSQAAAAVAEQLPPFSTMKKVKLVK